jgi:hypothetical protein
LLAEHIASTLHALGADEHERKRPSRCVHDKPFLEECLRKLALHAGSTLLGQLPHALERAGEFGLRQIPFTHRVAMVSDEV